MGLTGYLPGFYPVQFSQSLTSHDGAVWDLYKKKKKRGGESRDETFFNLQCNMLVHQSNNTITSAALTQALPNWSCRTRNQTQLSIKHKHSLRLESY